MGAVCCGGDDAVGAASVEATGAGGATTAVSATSARREPPKMRDATEGAPSARATDWRSLDRALLGDTGPLTF